MLPPHSRRANQWDHLTCVDGFTYLGYDMGSNTSKDDDIQGRPPNLQPREILLRKYSCCL
ncbi:hypothetical protein E2C01_091971 [Portunus trituberculatus]|uniref:Uncharacterized protein n=1 Tax=Portunus trituberculatus TaxID=210409 RepID=A0A5B7JQT6_PORTR|nr:hypothetical protein [Portunus trituberculatus]